MNARPRHAAWLFALLTLVAALGSAVAAERAAEHRVKAAYLYKFAGYIEWPDAAFAHASSPFVIGVLGADELAEELARITRGRSFGQRSIVVRRLQPGDALDGMHVLYVGYTDPQHAAGVLSALRGKPVLTVTAAEELGNSGSVINFVVVDNRIRFDVSLAPAEQHQLKISSLLLAVARRVDA